MRSFYVNVPFIFEAHVELHGVTRARKGLLDAALNPGCVELWAGPVHLTLDAPRKRPSMLFVAGAVMVALFMKPPSDAIAALVDDISAAVTEQARSPQVIALEIFYPSAQ